MKGLDGRRKMTEQNFIGRQHELKQMKAWLEDAEAPFRIFAISGVGGIGKSSLMEEMLRSAKERNILGIWLDARSFPQTPIGFLESLSASIGLEAMAMNTSYSFELLMKADPEHRVVICIDNVDYLTLLEGWILHAFLPNLPITGIAIILTSRPELSLAWKTAPFLYSCVIEMPLTNFTNGETAIYIRKTIHCQQEMAEELACVSEGYPLGLALEAEALMKSTVPDRIVLSQTISTHILKELPSTELQHLVDVLIVLPFANQEMLAHVLEEPVTIQEYQTLRRMSFIEAKAIGLTLKPNARIHLLRDFRLRKPKRFNELRTKAAYILNQQLQTEDKNKQKRIASQMLWLCINAFPLCRFYAERADDDFRPHPEPMAAADLPFLHELLASWCEYNIDLWHSDNYHQFLDELASSFPESIAVFRGEDKQPIGMLIYVLLNKETSQLLTKYFPVEVKECFKPEELTCNRNEADTYYAVLCTAADKRAGYSREELIGFLIYDYLSLLGEGLRAVMVATNPDVKEFLQRLGFHMRPASSAECGTTNERAYVLELDLRGNHFGNWIMSLINGKPEKMMAIPITDVTENETRKLLSLLNSPARLQDFAPFFIGEINGLKLQKHLLSLLTSEASELSEQDRKILYITYYTHANNRIKAMGSCNMSRATFYRHLNKAIRNFTEMLKNINRRNM